RIRSTYGIREKHIVFAAAQGLMLPRKGGEHLLTLAKAMPDVRFILAGAEGKAFPPNVTALPHIDAAEEMADFYRGADVFFITSKEDNFPTVCLESAACGTPVAGFISGGTAETVSPEISRFVPYGDTDALKRAAEELFLLTDKKKNALSAKGAEEMYSAYKKLYKEEKSGEN
ncbi:MAG: glycosyltransferase, partial [Clostridia bacterium]|nr:glycosyltransferase [Clostridia bacterium]